ncbi:MAG: hypothetical protein M1836_000292 [Candelina mexicana]|nr:MAG: hypothetical protein M1836_000292 [Candelina mexicana]
MNTNSARPLARKKQKTSHSGTADAPLLSRPNTRASKPRERAKSSTITDSEEPTSSDAKAPSSRTSSSIGFHEEMNDSDETFDASESAGQQSTDSDADSHANSEATEIQVSKRITTTSPTPPPPRRVVSKMFARPRVAAKPKHSTKKQPTAGRLIHDDTESGIVGRNKDSWKYKIGIKPEFPPIHDIGEIFDDMVQNAKEHTSIDSAIKHITDHRKGRKLRVATMCSGTESPMLALDLIASALAKHKQTLEVEHVFSAEIVPFKQAYIERNFSPPIIFRDIREFVRREGANNDLYRQKKATTAYGSLADIPKDVDLLVAGFSCVDFSALNIASKRELNSPGESGDTFKGVLQYADVFRPAMIVLENVFNAPWVDIKAAWESKGYAADFVKLDTKDYYIPHTRQRGYMLCINNDQTEKQPNMSVQAWKTLMGKLQRPASSSVEAFLLPGDDPRVHRGRAELAKGLRGEDKPPREVSWTKSQGRHLDYRADLALGNNRPMTAWEDNGSCKMPDYAWGDWARAQVERVWDTLEINKLRSARRGFDCEYKTRVWDLSQNIDRFTDTTPFGITGCVTPSGLPYVTSRGGPMIGLEALAMQGLPIEKLILTRETQRQLQDLAGNAMTTTVVGAAILSALTAGHQSLKLREGKVTQHAKVMRSRDALCDETKLKTLSLDISEFAPTSVSELLAGAKHSSRLCLCEGPSSITRTRLQRCEDCGYTTCVKCGGNPKHRYVVIPQDDLKQRQLPSVFEDQIKAALPMRLTITGLSAGMFQKFVDNKARESSPSGWSKEMDSSTWTLFVSIITRALGEELRFHSLIRAETWTAYYDSPHSRLELAITPYQAEWRLFAKPTQSSLAKKLKSEDLKLQQHLSQPFARMRPEQQGLLDGNWQIRLPLKYHFTMKVEGKGTLVPAWESMLGLQEPEFIDKQVWSTLRMSVDPKAVPQIDEDISGDYQLLADCGKASGSLHKRISPVTVIPVFFFLDPTRHDDPELDRYVFSTDIRRLEFGLTRYVISQFAPSWRPRSIEGPESLKCESYGKWLWYPEAALKPVSSSTQSICATPPMTYRISFGQATCEAANAILSCKVPIVNSNDSPEYQSRWLTVDKVNERSFLASFAWLTEKVRKIAGLSDWKLLSMPPGYVQCQRCAPDPPVVKWKTQKSKLVPFEDPEMAAPYERALKHRPSPFVILARVDECGYQLLKIGLNVSSLIHRALSNLGIKEYRSGVTLAWRLRTDYIPSSQPSFPRFKLLGNKADSPSVQPPSFRVKLRNEQLKSLAWMISQELGTIEPFEEEEVEEALLPQLGWLAEASAKKEVVVRGGVLADAVGYGKTATTLGLIDFQRNHQPTSPKFIEGKIPIKATLIVVPSHLAGQWEREIGKFIRAGCYNVLVIKTELGLSSRTIRDFIEADIILLSWSVLTGNTYLENLAKFAAVPDMPNTVGRAFNTWYAYALERLSSHVETLKTAGPQALKSTLADSLAERTLEDELNSTYVPSKRLRGKEYLADVASRRAAELTEQTALESGSSTTIDVGKKEIGKQEIGKKKIGKNEKGKNRKPKEAHKPTKKGSIDPFALGNAKGWKQVKRPLFQLFQFHRLVVDEYTYLSGASHASVISLQANMRWVLSGTPPMGDFADINKTARFLQIKLGIDDDSVGVTKGTNIKEMEKERTDVEKFRSFQEPHSSEWHQHRHKVAQEFLDRFVRQNVADIDEIPSEESYRPYHLPAAQRAIYLELHSHLMAQDMKIRKGRTKFDGDREKRMYRTLGDSKSPEEALLKRCSHFTLDDEEGVQATAIQACDHVVQQRQEQLQDLKRDLAKHLRHAVWLKAECGNEDKHYVGWKANVASNAFGDLETTDELRAAIKSATEDYDVRHGELFYKSSQEPLEVENRRKAASTKAAPKKPPTKAKKPQKSKLKTDSDCVDDTDFTNELASGSEEPLSIPLETKQQKIQALRNVTDHLRRLSIELVSRIRSLRYFQAVQEIQNASSEPASGNNCSKCLKKVELKDLSVFTLCGHKACHDCLEAINGRGICVDSKCKAPARDFQLVKATELGIQDSKEDMGGEYGKKLQEIIELIKGIEEEEQVLLFVQFDDLLVKVANALEDHHISYLVGKASGFGADKSINEFQEVKGSSKKKVLILNMAKESASGANLTNANHVIFLSPVLTDDQYGYDSSKAQAIGRAKRYGQLRTVKIYHFLALNTIDVDILQAREHKKLVEHEKEWKLVEKTSSLEVNGSSVPAKDFPDYGGRLAKNHWLFNEDI